MSTILNIHSLDMVFNRLPELPVFLRWLIVIREVVGRKILLFQFGDKILEAMVESGVF